MKKHRLRHHLSGIAVFLLLLCLYHIPVFASEAEALEEISNTSPEDTEFDHYTDEDGIQPYASSLTGKLNNIVIFLRFADDTDDYVTPARVQNGEKIFNSGSLSFKNYMNRISYGQINIDTYFYPQNAGSYYSIQLSKNADYYKKQYMSDGGTLTNGYTNETERRTREEELIREAAAGVRDQLSASGLNLDNNRDGFVDAVTFIVSVSNPSYEHVGHGDLLWAHKTDLSGDVELISGLKIRSYNLMDRGTDNTGVLGAYGELSGTVKHEFLHTLSMPDLYRYTDSSASTLGPWDIMDKGNAANITAWYQREYLEFGAKLPVYTASTKGISLKAAHYQDPNEVYAVILTSPYNTDESFVVEYRRQEEGCASQLNSGLLVYRIINSSKGPFPYGGNAGGPPDFIYAFRPGETRANSGDGKIGYATLSPDNPEGFTSLGKPLGAETPGYDNSTIYYSDGSNSGIVIDNLIRGSNDSMTFDVTFPEKINGNGTSTSPYEIYTAQNLLSLVSSSSGTYYKLMNDIDMSGVNFTPISEFKGILDGNHKTIKNLNISEKSTAGFIIDVSEGAIIKNLTFTDPVITSAEDYAAVFTDVRGTLDNICVKGGTMTSKTAASRAGGLTGMLTSPGKIQNCYTSAAVSANQAGGLVAYLSGGTITNSYSCGKITGIGSSPVTGGIFAYLLQSTGGSTSNAYWDIQSSGQTSNGLIWENGTPAKLQGCFGLQIDCPGAVSQGNTVTAKLASPNGSVSLKPVWESSSPSVIAVNSATGSITGKSVGTSAISCKFTIGSYTAVLSKTISCQGGSSGGNTGGGNTGDNSGSDTGGTASSALSGRWIASGNKWWFQKNDGSYPANGIYSIDGANYAFDASGWMITGWYSNKGHWYYFNSDGSMKKGWLWLNNTWYYLNPSNGQMYSSGIRTIGNSSYAFNSSGEMVTGWYSSSGSWYYFSSGGPMHKGWLWLNNTWYYLNPSNGQMYSSGIRTIGNSSYAFNGSGGMITGWYSSSGSWYYFNSGGPMHKGWLQLGSTWYYLNPSNGKMYSNCTVLIDGRYSSFNSNGAWLGYTNIRRK